MRKRPLSLACPALFAIAIAISASAQQAASDSSLSAEKSAFEAVCGSCHSTSMADGLRSEPDWRETVDVMRGLGAKGTDRQFDQLLRYLLRTQTKVNINTATAAQIAPVLDIGEPAAEALVKRRTDAGPFKTLDDLKKLPGMDPAKLEARKDRIIF